MTQPQDDRESLEILLPPGTPDGQRHAVEDDSTLITVNAGAGTGKTWVLSTRFVRLLLSDPDCLPQNILTLTYTDAAASEMRERIQKRAHDLPTQAGEGRRHAIREGFDEAWISTIHSFSARLIRESGLSLDIDPQSVIATPPQTEAFWHGFEQALDFLSLRELARTCGTPSLQKLGALLDTDPTLRAALSLWTASDLRSLAEEAAELHASLGHSPETFLKWAHDAEKIDDPQAARVRDETTDLLRPIWRDAWETWREIFSSLREEILDEREKQVRKAKGDSPEALLGALMDRWPLMKLDATDEKLRKFFVESLGELKGKPGKSNLFSAVKEILGNTVGEWTKSLEVPRALSLLPPADPLPEEERRLRATLLRLCALAWGLWDEMKRRLGLLSFTDMIRYARDSVFEEHRLKGFRHVLVDEFQDTDPLQFSLLEKLREKEGARLFAVGDPKQSIYKFRHADLTLFAQTIGRAESNVVLDVSFRTRKSLLERINSLFAHIWKNGLGASQGMQNLIFTPLCPPSPQEGQTDRDEGTTPPFSVLLTLKHGRSGAFSRLARQLAQTLADYVARGLTIWDKKEGRLRPIRWKDCTVLVRSRSSNPRLEAAFLEAEIPFVFEKNTDFLSRGEVNDVICLLRAVADPGDDTALASWLSSPFSGFGQTRIAECLSAAASSRASRFYDTLREVLPEAVEKLERLRLLSSLKGPGAIIGELLKDRRWLSDYDGSYRIRAVRNVAYALSLVRAYEQGLSGSPAGCARWLETALRREAKFGEPSFTDPEADAVRIATVHSSKGLEYPVVAVFCTPFGRKTGALVPSKKLGVAFSSFPEALAPAPSRTEPEAPTPFSQLMEKTLSEQGDLEEEQRLFYVAATRARDALLLCGIAGLDAKTSRVKLQKNDWISWTLEHLMDEQGSDDCLDLAGDVRLLFPDEEDEDRATVKKNEEGPETDDAPPARRLALPDQGDVVLSSFSATSFALFEWCPLAWRRRFRQGLDLRWEIPDDAAEDGEKIGGAELGSLAHWILAHWNLDETELGLWLNAPRTLASLDASLRDTWRDPRSKETLERWLSAFATSETGRLLKAALNGSARREAAFCVRPEGQKFALVGAMDVVWEDPAAPGSWHVLDYKISTSDAAPVALYMEQLSFYALVVRSLAKKRDLPFSGVDVGLIFLREGAKLKHRMVFPADYGWEALGERVFRAAQSAAVGDWPPRLEHCGSCPWALSCPKNA